MLFPPLSGRWIPLFKPQQLQRQQEILQEELARIYFYPALSLQNQEGPQYVSSGVFPSYLLSSVWPLLMMVPGVLLVQPTDHPLKEALPHPPPGNQGCAAPFSPRFSELPFQITRVLFSLLPAQCLAHPINGHGILSTDSPRPAGKGRSVSCRQKAGVALAHPTPAAHQAATGWLSQESEASRNSDKDKTKTLGYF